MFALQKLKQRLQVKTNLAKMSTYGIKTSKVDLFVLDVLHVKAGTKVTMGDCPLWIGTN